MFEKINPCHSQVDEEDTSDVVTPSLDRRWISAERVVQALDFYEDQGDDGWLIAALDSALTASDVYKIRNVVQRCNVSVVGWNALSKFFHTRLQDQVISIQAHNAVLVLGYELAIDGELWILNRLSELEGCEGACVYFAWWLARNPQWVIPVLQTLSPCNLKTWMDQLVTSGAVSDGNWLIVAEWILRNVKAPFDLLLTFILNDVQWRALSITERLMTSPSRGAWIWLARQALAIPEEVLVFVTERALLAPWDEKEALLILLEGAGRCAPLDWQLQVAWTLAELDDGLYLRELESIAFSQGIHVHP